MYRLSVHLVSVLPMWFKLTVRIIYIVHELCGIWCQLILLIVDVQVSLKLLNSDTFY